MIKLIYTKLIKNKLALSYSESDCQHIQNKEKSKRFDLEIS